MEKTIACGLLLAFACLFACCADGEMRHRARLTALVLFAVWMLYVSSWYAPVTLAGLARRVGLPASHYDAWALTDLAALTLILSIWRGSGQWWGVALACSLAGEGLCHVMFAAGLVSFGHYSLALDLGFLCQLGVLFLIGGPGVFDLLLRGWRAVSAGASVLAGGNRG